MEALLIEPTDDTPRVHMDPASDTYIISERSLPENAMEFYQPIYQWIDRYLGNLNISICFDFKLEYFNTASAKQLAKILLLLEKYVEKNTIKVNWYYKKEDNDMLASGMRYAKLINIKFDFIEY